MFQICERNEYKSLKSFLLEYTGSVSSGTSNPPDYLRIYLLESHKENFQSKNDNFILLSPGHGLNYSHIAAPETPMLTQ